MGGKLGRGGGRMGVGERGGVEGEVIGRGVDGVEGQVGLVWGGVGFAGRGRGCKEERGGGAWKDEVCLDGRVKGK